MSRLKKTGLSVFLMLAGIGVLIYGLLSALYYETALTAGGAFVFLAGLFFFLCGTRTVGFRKLSLVRKMPWLAISLLVLYSGLVFWLLFTQRGATAIEAFRSAVGRITPIGWCVFIPILLICAFDEKATLQKRKCRLLDIAFTPFRIAYDLCTCPKYIVDVVADWSAAIGSGGTLVIMAALHIAFMRYLVHILGIGPFTGFDLEDPRRDPYWVLAIGLRFSFFVARCLFYREWGAVYRRVRRVGPDYDPVAATPYYKEAIIFPFLLAAIVQLTQLR